jgi:hypothetical protein
LPNKASVRKALAFFISISGLQKKSAISDCRMAKTRWNQMPMEAFSKGIMHKNELIYKMPINLI